MHPPEVLLGHEGPNTARLCHAETLWGAPLDLCCSTVLPPSHTAYGQIPLGLGTPPPWKVSGIVAHTGAQPRTPPPSWAGTGSPNPKQSHWEAPTSHSPHQDLHSKLIPSTSANTQNQSPVPDPHTTTNAHSQHPIPTTSANTPYPVTRITMAPMPPSPIPSADPQCHCTDAPTITFLAGSRAAAFAAL